MSHNLWHSLKRLPLRSLGVVFDSRESLDLDIFELVGSGVRFCDNNRIVVFEVFAQFYVGWFKRFAVAAPRSIEFNKYLKLQLDFWKYPQDFFETILKSYLEFLFVYDWEMIILTLFKFEISSLQKM